MRYTYLEIVEKFNKELVNLINNGWILIPHSYSNGVIHDNFIKGNQAKVLELDKQHSDHNDKNEEMAYRERYILQIHTSQINPRGRYIDYNSWDFKKDYTTEVINRFYKISDSGRCNIYSDSYEECKEIGEIQRQRRCLYWRPSMGYARKVFNESYYPIALKYIQRQPKCKTVKLKDITLIEKRTYYSKQISHPVEYLVHCKGKSFCLR